MLSKRDNRKKLKRARKSKVGIKPDRLYKVIIPTRTSSRVLCTDNFFLSTVAASANIVFSGINAKSYDFAALINTTDWSENAAVYRYAKIHSVSFEISRVVDESTAYANLHGSALYLDHNPDLLSTAPSFANISRSESAYELDQLTFNSQKVTIPMLNISYQTAANGTFNNTWTMPVAFIPDIYGGLVTN